MRDYQIERITLRTDYERMLSRLRDAIENLVQHFDAHQLELDLIVDRDTDRARPYIADAAHAAFTVEQLILPASAAIDPANSRIWSTR